MAGRLASRSVFVPFVAWQSTVHDADYEHAGFVRVIGQPRGYYLGLLCRGWMYASCDHISIRRSASDAGSSLARSEYSLVNTVLSVRVATGSRDARSPAGLRGSRANSARVYVHLDGYWASTLQYGF